MLQYLLQSWEYDLGRQNIGFIVEFPAPGQDDPVITSVTLSPSNNAALGGAITVTASGIANADRAEFITRNATGVETVIHSVQNPGASIAHTYTANDVNINQIIVRVHRDALNAQAMANITVLAGADDPTVIIGNRPPTQFHRDPIVTNIGVFLEWNNLAGNLHGFRIFRAASATADGISISDFPIRTNPAFSTTTVFTFDPNVRPGSTYYYYIREVIEEARFDAVAVDLTPEVLGPPSTRVRVTIPAGGGGGDQQTRGFITMIMGNPMMNVNNVWEEIDPGVGTAPIIESGRTMVPIRAIVEAMSGTVGWDAADSRIELTALGNRVLMWLGRHDIHVNSAASTMDVVPTVINDRTLIPLRFVAESLDTQVEWIGSQNMAVIVYPLQ